MKKTLTILFVMVLAVSMLFVSCKKEEAAATSTTAAAKTVNTKTLQVAFNQSESHPQYKALVAFSDAFYEATNGRYKFDVKPNELLGDQASTVEMVQDGAIDMSMIGGPLMENFNKDFGVLCLPFIYDDLAHQEAVFTSGLLDDLFASTEELGFRVAAACTAGFRSVYTDKEVKTPADLKGYKIRVMQSDTMLATLNAMGGVATAMGQGEVYTAIQQGVIEGGENNEITYNDLKHYEIAPEYSYTRHLAIPDILIISSITYDSFSAEDQATFDRLAKEFAKEEFKLWAETIDSAKANAEANGAHFYEIDNTPFREACQSVTDKLLVTDSQKKLYADIRALAK